MCVREWVCVCASMSVQGGVYRVQEGAQPLSQLASAFYSGVDGGIIPHRTHSLHASNAGGCDGMPAARVVDLSRGEGVCREGMGGGRGGRGGGDMLLLSMQEGLLSELRVGGGGGGGGVGSE